MSRKKIENVLPAEVIELIQQYVDGQNIYIPRKAESRREWGTGTSIKEELSVRNQEIFNEYLAGAKAEELSKRYFLTEKSIRRIIREMKICSLKPVC
ncbi:MAG: hypothetical protein IKK96_02615 [Lachnospiraceae bacterium]|nr:hypothetical protein [Lachnospiraceae bacterium]